MRRLLIALAVLLAVAGGGSFAVWRWAVGQMQTQWDAWSAAQQALGWTIAHGEATSGGWPLAAELSLPNLTISGLAADLPGGVAWSAERVTLRVSVLEPRLALAVVEGAQRLRLSLAPEAGYTAKRFVFSVPLPPDGPPRAVALDASDVRFANGASAGLLQSHVEAAPDAASAQFRVSAEAISFPPPPAPQPALGAHIASATLEGAYSGALPASAASPAAAAAQWQAHDGKIELRRIAVGWGPLGVSGNAAFGLDPALQPSGGANLHVVGYDEALQALAAGHVLSPQAARAAAAVLGLMAATPEGGGAPAVDVPLALHDRTLSMGRIPLAKLPELVWPNAPVGATTAP